MADMSERTLLVGYDLCDRKTQLAVFNRDTREPELIGQTDENPDALFDAVMEFDNGLQIKDFMSRIRRGEELLAGGEAVPPVRVLAGFFRKTLSYTRQKYPSETIKQLVVTIPHQSVELIQIIYDALDVLGIGRERALVISHKQSYLYFALSQKAELWVNDVGMFDYSGERLTYYQIQVDRRKTPALAGVWERDYSDAIEIAEGDEAKKDVVFENVVLGAIHRQVLSVLYMTGDGFEGGWADDVFQRLCVGRRLFKGSNLYVSGACYAAREIGENAKLSDFILLDEDMISCHLSVMVYADARLQEQILAKAGTPWYQVDTQIDLIPDGETDLAILAKNVFTGEEKEYRVELEPISGKADRHCRLAVRLRFSDIHTCIVTVKDKGFGNLFPTSNRIWEKTIRLENNGAGGKAEAGHTAYERREK